MKIIESYAMIEPKQIKFPRKRNNKRWQKKYKKKYSVQFPRTDFLISGNNLIICHPIMAKEIRKEFANNPLQPDRKQRGG